MAQFRVLIVGASVAGPTAAYWLARAGAQVTIIERFPSFRVNGQGIDIRTAGVQVMRKMPGMEAAVRAKTTTEEGVSFVDTHGQSYGTLRATGNPDRQGLVSEIEIFRGDLAQILFDLTQDNENIKYVFGEQVASIGQGEKEDGSVTVEFMNGKLPTQKYDLVVACDGATSRNRAIGFGCGSRDHITPINTWAAYFTLDEDLLGGSKIGQGYSAVGGRFLSIGPDPSRTSKVCLISVHPWKDRDAILPFLNAAKQGDNALKQYVAKRYEDAGWKSTQLIKGMVEAQDFYASEWAQVKMPSLYKGRFVLVGDAGYAPGPTGGGTTLALTGAYVLAGEICKHKGDIDAAFAGYEETMRPIITDFQKIPPGIPGIMAPQTVWGIWLRNTIFGFVTWTGMVEFVQRWFGAAMAETDKFKLPEYDWVR